MNLQSSSKDIRRIITGFLDDRDVLKFCQIDKEQNNNVCNEDFFRNILMKRYPDTLNYIYDNRLSDGSNDLNYISNHSTFKRWYLSVVHYVDLLKIEYGFDYKKYNRGNPKHQYKILHDLGTPRYMRMLYMNGLLPTAAFNGELALVQFALENGANVHTNNDDTLRAASENGHLEIVKYLLENGSHIHARNDAALRWASLKGHLEIVKYLVENGANIHAENDEALRWTKMNRHLKIIEYLNSLAK